MSELLDEIERRIKDPEAFTEMAYGEDMPRLMARAVATLFETADHEASSKLRTIDLPAELKDAAVALRTEAEDYLERGEAGTADRLGFLANCVEETSHLIVEPARMLQTLMRDRDQWQALEKQLEEMLALTEAALGVSQKSNVALAEGQSKLIGLLERVARADAGWTPFSEVEETPQEHPLLIRVDSFCDLYGNISEKKYWKRPYGTETVADIMPEIHAVLAQVTAIETVEGRLTVTSQPEGERTIIPSQAGEGVVTERLTVAQQPEQAS